MTDETIRHPREIRLRNLVGLLETPMASLARILRVEPSPHISGRRKILTGIDGLRQQWRDIAEFEVLLMAESGHR